MDKKDLADNKTKIFIAILDLVSKHIPPKEYKRGEDISDNLRNIIKSSINLTQEAMVELILKK
jgi:hypothetical protein